MRKLLKLVPVLLFGLAGCNIATTQQNWISTNSADVQSTELTQKRCNVKADIAYLKALSGVQEKKPEVNVNVDNSITIAKKNQPVNFSSALDGLKAAQESQQRELKIQQQQKIQKALENIRGYEMASCMGKAGYRLQVTK